ncbi:MAG: hypothetical protein CMN28_08360 [Salinisphaeraceae bacterium]|nr:hypothetical protein [Salinisphaeraceae bacterium]
MLAGQVRLAGTQAGAGAARRAVCGTLGDAYSLRAYYHRFFMLRPLATLLLMLCALPSLADIQAQRTLYQETLPRVASSGIGSVPEAVRALRGYPLYPYLLAADLEWRMRNFGGPALDHEIEAFINSRPGLPRTNLLRLRWISHLYSRGAWARVISLVRDDDSTTQQCRRMVARIRLGESGLSAPARTLWLVGSSQPDACDPVFDWMEQQGLLTASLVLERARLAAVARNPSLVRYLAKKLPDPQAGMALHWAAMLGSPGDLHHVSALDGDVAVSVFKRLALQDTQAAADLIPELRKRLSLTDGQVHEMRRYVGLLLAQNHDPRAVVWFDSLQPADDDSHGLEWRIRSALFNNRWDKALAWIDALPESLRSTEEWRYWRARALEAQGRREQAKPLYLALAEERSYHGYLASDRLGERYSFNRNVLKQDAAFRQSFSRRPAVARALEFLAIDEPYDANREWAAATDGMSEAELQQAALFAHQHNWHFQAIITLAKSDYWDDLGIRYPLPYREHAEHFARQHAVDPAYVMAIMRTESLFQPVARSPAGAVGLMQLMPATARKVANDLELPRPDSEALKTPYENINLGTRYLQEQLQRFSGNYALASAAYNAGPHRVSRWLPDVPVAADIWVENIPYTETREYVKRAMSHMTIFELRLEQPVTRVTDRISPIGPDSEVADSL